MKWNSEKTSMNRRFTTKHENILRIEEHGIFNHEEEHEVFLKKEFFLRARPELRGYLNPVSKGFF